MSSVVYRAGRSGVNTLDLVEPVILGSKLPVKSQQIELDSLCSFGKDFPTYKKFNPMTTILAKRNWTIPGQGAKAEYCHKPFISHISGCGSAAKEVYVSCGLATCPDCYPLWIANQVFDNAVKIEAYAKITGSRPFRYVGSVNYSQGVSAWTLQDYRNFNRNLGDRLMRQGVDAGLKVFHAFRIKKNIQDEMRSLLGLSLIHI